MRTVAGHQANHLPYGGYFAKMNVVDCFVVVDNTQYVKKEFHNRNRILTMHGRRAWLSVPVRTSGRFDQKINEVQINNSIDWRRRHLRTIELSYRKTRYFDSCFSEFEAIYQQSWEYLADLNLAIIERCRSMLGIRTPLLIGSRLGIDGKASRLIVDICRKTSSDIYLHGMHSRDYVDFSILESAGIRSRIQDFRCQSYPQSHSGAFVPNLSVVDLLFNCGPKSLAHLMAGNSISEYGYPQADGESRAGRQTVS